MSTTQVSRPPSYPGEGTYADLLYWHLFVWGTRPDGSIARLGNQPWTKEEFRNAVFGKRGTSPDAEPKNYKSWIGDAPDCRAPGPLYSGLIERAIFGGEPKFQLWEADLRRAQARSAGAGNNRRSIDLEATLAELARGGLVRSASPTTQTTPETWGSVDTATNERINKAIDEVVTRGFGVRRELMEMLALRFGHETADDSDDALVAFLKARAAEYSELKARIASLVSEETRLSNVLGSAAQAVEAGRFEEAEESLRIAEEQQLEDHTLKSIRVQSRICVARGEAAFLAGDPMAAHHHFERAARIFHEFSIEDEFYLRGELSGKVLQRSPYGAFEQAALDLVEPALGFYPPASVEFRIGQLWAGRCHCRSDYVQIEQLRTRAHHAGIALGHFALALESGGEPLLRSVAVEVLVYSAMAHLLVARERMVDRDYLRASYYGGEAITCAQLAMMQFDADDDPKRWVKCNELIIVAVVAVGLHHGQELSSRFALFEDAVDRLMARRDISIVQVYSLELSGSYLRFAKMAASSAAASERERIYGRMAEIFEFTKDSFALNDENEQSRSFFTEELEDEFVDLKREFPCTNCTTS